MFDIGYIISPYTIVFVFLIIGVLVGCLIYFVSYLFVFRSLNNEKASSYECGFDPFFDSDSTFDVRYYLVSILFIIFDLELTFLFPWSVAFYRIGNYGHLAVLIFIFILALGFSYEWICGALDWELVFLNYFKIICKNILNSCFWQMYLQMLNLPVLFLLV